MPHREYRSPFQNQQNDSHADHQSRLQSTLPFPGHSNSSTQQCSTHSSQFAPSTQPLQSPVQSLPTSNSVDNSALSGCRSDQYSQCGSNQSNSQFVPSQPLELTQSPQPAMPSSEPHSQAVSYAHSAPHIESVNSRRACIMPTAQLVVFDKNGQPVTCRALLDSGSDSCFISRQLASRLQLPSVCTGGTVHTVSGSNATLLNLSSLNIHSPDHTWSTRIDCIVTEKITPSMPPPGLNLSDFDIPPNIILADSSFFEISGVDILLNVDVYAMLHLPGQIRLSESCVLQNTRLGWVTWGSIPVLKPTINQCISNFVSNLDHSNEHVTNADISKQLEKFWRMEEIDVKTSTPTEHAQIEQHYIDNVRRMDDGRFSVALPKKETFHSLGQSYKQALTRFHSLEKRLAANAELKKQYTEFMEEYINLGHMSPAPESSYQEFCYHIPHHPVFKPDSTTTKLRVVFDASAKSVTGLSLNDVIHIGPTVQPELFETVLRFRTHRIAFIADVTKMYRQILVHPEDRNVQRIFWRSDENQPVQEYFLNTVTYGTSSAPYLATRTLNHLADVECPPNSAVCHALKEDFYVDDLISGSSTIESAIELSHQLLTTVDRGKMELRKWLSNSTELLATIPPHLVETATSRPLSDSSDSVVKALGLIWNSTTDQLIISSSITDVALKTSFTKRELLSSISSIFDPLGLISPVVILPKLLFQKLWLHKLDWDDKLPPELLTEWLSILKELPNISNIAIPRCVLPPSTDVKLELHAFSDASATAYGACLYIRSISSNGVQVKLLTSKSKVASIKPLLTIPRLELQAAHLSAKLVVKAIQASKLKFSNVVLWTDSKIVCDWLKALPNRADVFVSVRVSTIQNLTADFTWKHVRTKHNPADLVSRGCTPATLINSSLWWNGPSWLSEPEATWNDITVNVAVLRPISTNATRVTPSVLSGIISKLSEYHRMVRATAYVLRFVHNLIHHKEKDQHRLNDLSVEEIQSAEIQLIRTVQEEAFAEEIRQLKQGKELLPSSSLKALSPFIDNNSLLRVGGRLRQSDLPYDYKHQILLPSKHRFTHALIISYHRRVSHDGVQSTMAALRQRYWVISTRRTVKSVLKSCHLCFRFSKFRAEQIMGQLPPVRIQSDFPFFNSGIDYAGPFSLLIGTRKSRTYSKAYLALFVCMVTKAVHVEIVSELTTKAFIAALIRFSSRRGIPHALYSDNATTFVGAHNELQELHNFFEAEKTQKDIHNYTSVLNIGWHFIPPRAPSFGGLWENAIKNFKRIFKVVTFNQILNFEDMATFASQIEAILNSRPLVPLSEDPNDLQYLSPGHFLIGRPLTALPFHSPPTTHLDNRCRWKNLQRITQDLWDRWSKEYLVTLQRKNKWLMENDNITVDTMVLLKDINSAPSTWKLARVIETHPGADGKVRVVTIQTSHGKFKRAITSLAPLPFYDDD
ncbi:uncharacterized protein LOC111054948 [Nilaparvata lugens]|uniref:uncharacterized protein LOC111054948 n=1 Tax=Nilaparvata lugens TaxID=108931 RepID=UPI000B99AD20|nr:uncharacterized protein LOC111054948 [Nilaparvata lugens]XP_022197773.1 uncharacterized protein LOC111054948 [Nilaparvata lugens]